jgi:peptide deformylase
MDLSDLKIVSPDLIPKGEDCPLNDLAFLYRLAFEMEQICERENGIGLSAVQVGVPYKFFIIKFDKGYRYFIDCEYDAIDDTRELSMEGCLSLKNDIGKLRYFEVERLTNVRITGKELLTHQKLAIGSFADCPKNFYKIVFQHEIDHHRMVLISDIGVERNGQTTGSANSSENGRERARKTASGDEELL